MNVAVITPYNLFIAKHGNAIRVNAMINALKARDHEISLFMYDLPTLRKDDQTENTNMKVYSETAKTEIILMSILTRIVLKASTFDFLCSKFKPTRNLDSTIRRIIKKDEIDVLQCENIWTVPPVAKVAKQEGVPIVATAHDVWTDRFVQLYNYQGTFKFASKALLKRIKEAEISAIKSSDLCACVSIEDHERFVEMGINKDKLVVIPNGVDTRKIRPVEKNEELKSDLRLGKELVLLFPGSNMFQNKKAVDDICQLILPRITKNYPNVKIIFAGTICNYVKSAGYQDKLPNNVLAVGYVEDLAPYYGLADIVLIPITVGSGTKLKTIEAMAAGKAIVSTKAGITGLNVEDEVDIMVEDDVGRFHKQIRRLAEDPDLRDKIGKNARETSLQYDWSEIMKKYDSTYKALAPYRS